jgi:hypothetical protein
MEIIGIDGLSGEAIEKELNQGAKFVMYQYCVSFLIMTLKRPSNIYFIRAGEGAVGRGLKFSLMSLLLGWWGIPWGPIYTISTIVSNFGGGADVTDEVLASFQGEE